MLPFLVPRSVFGTRTAKGHRFPSVKALRNHRSQLKPATIPARNFADVAEEDSAGNENVNYADDLDLDINRRQAEHNRWLMGEGAQYRRPKENGPNWLGGNVPFPMNPTFKPPVPISDYARNEIYNEFIKGKPEQELASAYGLGVSRIKAILRLKKLEELWIKEQPRQLRFQTDMERYLGVSGGQDEKNRAVVRERRRANNIDMDVDTYRIGQSRKLQRVFFEVVEEGQPSPLASHLDQIQATIDEEVQEKATKHQSGLKGSLRLVPTSALSREGQKFSSATKYAWFYPAKVGRPPYTFVDVGNRYLKRGKKVVVVEEEAENKKKHKEEARAKRHAAQMVLAHKALALRRPQLVREREELEKIFKAETKIAVTRQKILEERKQLAETQQEVARSKAAMDNLQL